MTNYLCLLILLCAVVSVDAQQLHGRITSSQTQEPLAAATIQLLRNGSSTQSGADGEFALSIPTTTHTLILRSVGYLAKRLAVEAMIQGRLDNNRKSVWEGKK